MGAIKETNFEGNCKTAIYRFLLLLEKFDFLLLEPRELSQLTMGGQCPPMCRDGGGVPEVLHSTACCSVRHYHRRDAGVRDAVRPSAASAP